MNRIKTVAKTTRRLLRPRVVLPLLLAASLATSGWAAWSRFLAPTRIALVNFRDFQYAEMLESNDSRWVVLDRIPLDKLAETNLKRFDAVYLFGRGLNLDEPQQAAVRRGIVGGTHVYVNGATNAASDVTDLAGDSLKRVGAYFENGGRKNLASLFRYTRRVLDGKTLFAEPADEPQVIPQDALFHIGDDRFFGSIPDYLAFYKKEGKFKAGRPKVCLLTSIYGPRNPNLGSMDELIRRLEAKQLNVFPIAGFLKRLDFIKEIEPDLVVYVPHGRLAPGRVDEAIRYLEDRGIPLLCPVGVMENHDAWVTSQKGMQGGMMSQNIVMPELDGGTEPYAVSALYPNERGLDVPRAIPERVETFVARVERWLTLRKKPNAEKKLAIVYYKGPGQNAMAAAALEVAPSLLHLLRRLKAEGYDTGTLPNTVEEFQKRVQRQGPVFGAYAEGAFEGFLKAGDPEMIAASDYLAWVKKGMAPEAYAAVEKQYGPAPGQFLSVEREGKSYLALPRVQFGNVVLLPQLLPALGDDSSKLVHGAKVAPPHPYLATYLYARYGFHADALMHFGTHGSLEFTPWKQNALSQLDWPDALVGDLPHFYLYIINNIGEAVIAKRRSYATLVSHLTPPFAESELYGPLKQLQEAIGAYQTTTDSALKAELVATISKLTREQKLNKDLNFPEEGSAPLDDDQIEKVHDYLMTVGLEKIMRGLYTLGTPYPAERVVETARLMAVDGVGQARARLDQARGAVTAAQAADPKFFDDRYHKPAFETLDRILAGTAAPESFLDPADLGRLARWEKANRTTSDDEFFANLLKMAEAPKSGETTPEAARRGAPKFDDGRLQELLLAVASDPDKIEFIRSLGNEAQFQRTASALDPESRKKARRVAALIPAMKKALDLLEKPDVFELVAMMRSKPARDRVFTLLDDPSMKPKLEAGRARARAEAVARLVAPESSADLFAAFGEAPLESLIEPWDRARLQQFRGRLLDYSNHADLVPDLVARGEGAAADVAAILKSRASLDAIKEAVNAADRRLDALAEREREYVGAVRILRDALTSVVRYRDGLAASTNRELASLIGSLGGRYVPPSSGGDAISNPDAVPTGRNLISIDAEKTPSAEAWRVGKVLAEEMIRAKRRDSGRFPKKVAVTLWAGEFINSQGVDVAIILHLLGVEPVRNARGEVHDVRLVPASELKRPRIDVVVQTSGQIRDIAASRMNLIDRAVKLASKAEDPADSENNVRLGTIAAEAVMKEKGLSPADAKAFATARIFGGVNGNYGTGIMGLVESGDRWENDKEVSDQYLKNMGAVYLEDRWGAYTPGVFEGALQNTDTLMHSRTSNLNGPLSLDHVYEFMGGLNATIRNVTGREPDAYFADMRNKHKPVMQGAKEAVWMEARSTLLNPKYIKDLQAGGSSSAAVFAETFRNTYGWNVMKPEAVDDELWNQLYAVYVEDREKLGLRRTFDEKNPFALQEMTAVMMETARKGLWKASPEQLRTLAVLHTDLIRDHRPGCSGFVCDNAKLRETIQQNLTPEAASLYASAIDGVRNGTNADKVRGMTLERETLASAPSMTQDRPVTGMLAAGGVLILVVGLVVSGYTRRRD